MKRDDSDISVEELKQLFEVYDEILINRRRRGNTPEGAICGYHCLKDGYIWVGVYGKRMSVHRVVWAIANGRWPDGSIDHLNGVRSDNRACNLRVASPSENNLNWEMHRTGKLPGANWNAKARRWQAVAPKCYLNRNASGQKYLGLFRTMEEAGQAVYQFCEASSGE